ncbi:HelD family protein [Ruania albidiflava]|uniref:HelD family protein n=3 Tax=Ruania albidiflava TaxID=366586 RepID=UPI0003B4FEAD|nr:UvrD-helicase domain-containing protein [Ruania albidiflava]
MSRHAIRLEQQYLDRLYQRVDELRAETADQLAEMLRAPGTDSTALLDRDAQVARLEQRTADLARAEQGLCFGRLDRTDDSITYIGRMGLRAVDLEPLVIDWRAPAAADFYTATAASGSDVRRRRHLRTRGRQVVAVNDELLQLDHDGGAPVGGSAPAHEFVGEAALMQALAAERTGRMADIVTTLQAEQDAIIRTGPEGMLVVQGGPGTGKTAVALHRVAYLLYTYPTIAERGVLVLGPSPAFLDYIGQVLPSLGETQAVTATLETLLPGVVATRTESVAAAAVKALPVMADVVSRAVRRHQGSDVPVTVTYQGDAYRLGADVLARCTERARLTGLPHNEARRTFVAELLDHLTEQVITNDRQLYDDADRGFETEIAALDAALARGTDSLPAAVEGGGTEVTGLAARHEAPRIRGELAADGAVRHLLEDLWPRLSPTGLLEALYAEEGLLAEVAPELDDEQRAALRRAPGGGWSSGDVPLLDEAAELLGADDSATEQQRQARREAGLAYARQVIAASGGLGVSAEELADRFTETDTRPLAERAAADRTWAYGHVIVDEAQELTPMQWRMVLRRVPTRSLTVVGDVHQTAAVAGTTAWDQLVTDHPSLQVRQVELSINYRTPEPVMVAATEVLRAAEPGALLPECARTEGAPPWVRIAQGDLAGELASAVVEEQQQVTGGTFAVIAPRERLVEMAMTVEGALPGTSFGSEVDLTAACVVLTPEQAKGLEFDGVLVVDPATILAGRRGVNGLYVAMTRATRRLGLLCDGPVPEELAGVAGG